MRLCSPEGNTADGVAEFAALVHLRTELDAEDFAMVIATLRAEATKQLARFSEQSAAGDFEGTCKIAHSLAGLFAQFGAIEAACLARALSSETTTGEHHGLHHGLHHKLIVSCRNAIDVICRNS